MVFETKKENDVVNDILVNLVTNVDKINDINPGSVIRTLVEGLSGEISEEYRQMQQIYDGTSITTSTGTDLENLAALFGLVRQSGTKASGYVTFRKNANVAGDFLIPAGTVVSTQPVTGVELLKFKTTGDATFDYYITGETFTFYEGINRYKASQRWFIEGPEGINTLSGTKSSAPKTFVRNTDWNRRSSRTGDYVVTDIGSVVVIDDCNATTGWTNSSDCIAVATEGTEKVQGTNSLALGKTGASQAFIFYEKTLAVPISADNRVVFLNVWFKDQTTVDKFWGNFIFTIGSGSSGSDAYRYTINSSKLEVGWNLLALNYKDYDSVVTIGTPDISNISHIEIYAETLGTPAIDSGDVLIDFIYAAEAEKYRGNVITFTDYSKYPDHSTVITYDWYPASWDVECEALDVGEIYNVSSGAIQYQITPTVYVESVNNYSAFTNGVDIESDELLRTKIIGRASTPGKATRSAIVNSVMDISGVTSVTLIDRPSQVILTEPQVFHSGIDTYKLNNEVPLASIGTTSVHDTADPYPVVPDYKYGVDYIINVDGEIEWLGGGSTPLDGAVFYVCYEINQLGRAQLIVSGTTYPISSAVSTEIEDTIEETKPVGVIVTWREPFVFSINIACSIVVNNTGGYNETTVKNQVDNAIVGWLNTHTIDESLKLSEFYSIVMGVPGVINVVLNNWNSETPPYADILCPQNYIIKAGTITVT